MPTNKTTEQNYKTPKLLRWNGTVPRKHKTLIYQTFVAYLQPKKQILNAALIVHKYSPLDATRYSTRGYGDIPVSRAAVSTAVSPGRGSERTQCPGWRQRARDWRSLEAPTLV